MHISVYETDSSEKVLVNPYYQCVQAEMPFQHRCIAISQHCIDWSAIAEVVPCHPFYNTNMSDNIFLLYKFLFPKWGRFPHFIVFKRLRPKRLFIFSQKLSWVAKWVDGWLLPNLCSWKQEPEPGAVQLGGSKYFNHHSDIPLTRVKSKHNLNC